MLSRAVLSETMWSQVYQEIIDSADEMSNGGTEPLFFRGHSRAHYSLIPGLGRHELAEARILERRLYFNFVVKAGSLLSQDNTGWSHLFSMQHHGMPTRLLDWTETFGIALYFAVARSNSDAAIWLLRPQELNQRTMNCATIVDVRQLGGAYEEFYIQESISMAADVVALAPPRYNPRVAQQRAAFTLHDDLRAPLEQLHPDLARRVVIPINVHEEARRFLTMAGISEFTLFPDLDGLTRDLKQTYLKKV